MYTKNEAHLLSECELTTFAYVEVWVDVIYVWRDGRMGEWSVIWPILKRCRLALKGHDICRTSFPLGNCVADLSISGNITLFHRGLLQFPQYKAVRHLTFEESRGLHNIASPKEWRWAGRGGEGYSFLGAYLE